MTTVLLLIACPLAWACLDLLRKYLAPHGRAVPLILAMVLGQTPFFLAWVAFDGSWAITPGYWLPALLSVGFNILANLCYMRSVQLSPMSATLPLLSLTPVFTTVLAVPLLGEVPSALELVGVLVVVVGAFLLNADPARGFSPGVLWRALVAEKGSPLMVAVAVFWSFAPIFDKQALRYASSAMHGLVLSVGLSVFLLAWLAGQKRLGELGELRPAAGILTATVVCSVVALGVQLLAIQLVWVGLLETLKRSLGSVLALVFGRLLFRESFTWQRTAAVAVMSLGVALVLLR